MERKNITLDERTLEAAAHLQEFYGITTTSATIRYAVTELAKRAGWRPERRQRRDQAPGAEE